MDRKTRQEIKVKDIAGVSTDFSIAKLSDKILNLILNGPTLMSVKKYVLHSMVRELYTRLSAYEETGLTPEEIENAQKAMMAALGMACRIQALQDENSRLRAQLERVTAERDKAIEDLREVTGEIESCFACKLLHTTECKHIENCHLNGNKDWQWRGLEEPE